MYFVSIYYKTAGAMSIILGFLLLLSNYLNVFILNKSILISFGFLLGSMIFGFFILFGYSALKHPAIGFIYNSLSFLFYSIMFGVYLVVEPMNTYRSVFGLIVTLYFSINYFSLLSLSLYVYYKYKISIFDHKKIDL